jgi:PTS system nitrogen regulatory IIA component
LELKVDVTSFLSTENVVEDYRAESKGQLLNELCMRASQATGLDVETVSGEIMKREQLGSTGVGGGVAIPHGRILNLTKPFGILVRLRKPLDYDAIDGEPVDIVFLLLIPASADGQLNALAAIARKLRDRSTLARMREATESASLYDAFVA